MECAIITSVSRLLGKVRDSVAYLCFLLVADETTLAD
jgi:hypothetical protein